MRLRRHGHRDLEDDIDGTNTHYWLNTHWVKIGNGWLRVPQLGKQGGVHHRTENLVAGQEREDRVVAGWHRGADGD